MSDRVGESERRQRIESLFEAALERPAAARAAWLSGACSGDRELQSEVEALLAAHGRSGGVLDLDLVRGGPAVEDPIIGERIGPYRIEREIGRGGMGVVYLGRRADGAFRRRVAIKVLGGSANAEELNRRFEAERQILASLEHPNIAHLLDGGLTGDGRQYLVMEYIDGLPIDVYCDRKRLTIEQRLRLFCTVVRAVHHAHSNLVVHRDLKPSNIFVTEDGLVKLLDFGIAKILGPTAVGHHGPVTRTGLRLMTPEYASPEQIRGGAITTATDVYGLGVILFELLAGRRPFDLQGRSAGEMERIILEVEPPRPSMAVRGPGAGPREGREADSGHWSDPGLAPPPTQDAWTPLAVDPRSLARQTQRLRLSRRLRGDLDRIVLMALRKEPERRYASAVQLAEDIERHLRGLPVIAHSDSRWYRLQKFIRRHRAQASAAAIVAVSLIAGSGVALWQAAAARAERDRAARALSQSEDVTEFLIGLFESSDPKSGPVDVEAAREVLQRGFAQAEALAGQPDVQARMFVALGRVYMNIGEFEQAQGLLERSLDLRRMVHGENHLGVAESLAQLAELQRRRSRYQRADTLYRHALEIQRRLLGDHHPVVAQTLTDHAYLTIYLGRPNEAEALYYEVLAMRGAGLDPEDPLVAEVMISMATLKRRAGRVEEAESFARDALALRRRIYGPTHPDVASAMLHLGDLLAGYTEKTEEAESLFRNSLALVRRQLGNDHPALFHPLSSLGGLLADKGEFAEAEPLYREALALRGRLFGLESANYAEGLEHLANLQGRRGLYDESERLRRQALEIWKSSMGPDHPVVAGSLEGLGNVLADKGEYDEAESLLREALAMRRRQNPEHPLTALNMVDLAAVLTVRGRFEEAESLLKEALAVITLHYDESSRDVRDTYAGLVRLYEAWGEPELAEKYRALAGGP